MKQACGSVRQSSIWCVSTKNICELNVQEMLESMLLPF